MNKNTVPENCPIGFTEAPVVIGVDSALDTAIAAENFMSRPVLGMGSIACDSCAFVEACKSEVKDALITTGSDIDFKHPTDFSLKERVQAWAVDYVAKTEEAGLPEYSAARMLRAMSDASPAELKILSKVVDKNPDNIPLAYGNINMRGENYSYIEFGGSALLVRSSQLATLADNQHEGFLETLAKTQSAPESDVSLRSALSTARLYDLNIKKISNTGSGEVYQFKSTGNSSNFRGFGSAIGGDGEVSKDIIVFHTLTPSIDTKNGLGRAVNSATPAISGLTTEEISQAVESAGKAVTRLEK